MAVFKRKKERAPALVVGAVYGRCGSRRRLPGGSAGREGEDTSTGLKWRCGNSAGVGGTRLAAVLTEKERVPALA